MTSNSTPTDILSIISEVKQTYTKDFDPSNRNWSIQPEYTYLFLKSQENYLSDLLHARGHVFLNDVYDSLNIKRTPVGQIVGWILDGGVGHISFGLPSEPKNTPIIPTDSIPLEFNVDGVIVNQI